MAENADDEDEDKLDDQDAFHENVKALEAKWTWTIPSLFAKSDFLNPELRVQFPEDSYQLSETPLSFEITAS